MEKVPFPKDQDRVQLGDIPWDDAKKYPLSEEDLFAVEYMADVEANTLYYVRDLIQGGVGHDPVVGKFLSIWLYQETVHGEALRKFLAAYGREISITRQKELHDRMGWRDASHVLLLRIFNRISPHVCAVYLTWGAIQECTTLTGYQRLIQLTSNPVLHEVVRRIAAQEGQHYHFYAGAAQVRIQHPKAKRLVLLALRNFWAPVGQGLKSKAQTRRIMAHLFQGPDGEEAAERVDRMVDRQIGLDDLSLLRGYRESIFNGDSAVSRMAAST